VGLPIGQDCHLHNLLFADNLVVIAQNTEDAEYMINKLIEEHTIMWAADKFGGN
jgi:hypothetical protein